MSKAPNGSTDYSAIGKVYRERLGGNPFGIEPDEPPKPPWKCNECGLTVNPDGTRSGSCTGMCCM